MEASSAEELAGLVFGGALARPAALVLDGPAASTKQLFILCADLLLRGLRIVLGARAAGDLDSLSPEAFARLAERMRLVGLEPAVEVGDDGLLTPGMLALDLDAAWALPDDGVPLEAFAMKVRTWRRSYTVRFRAVVPGA